MSDQLKHISPIGAKSTDGSAPTGPIGAGKGAPASSASQQELTPLQRAALTIKQLRMKLDRLENKAPDPIAIVSMSCRYPGSPDVEAFWETLNNKVDAVQEVPAERWDLEEWFDPRPEAPGKINTRFGGFIEGVDLFDADFFSIPANEAKRMDPGQRILLELVWEALERAYIPPDSLRGSRTGFFVGMNQNDYGMMQLSGNPEDITAYTGTGNGLCFTSGRVSYQFGFQGPTVSSDTACSSSMVALHQAVQSLHNQECEIAIVAGVQMNLAPSPQVFFSRTQSFSPHGRCFAFDKKADGFVLGEGVGVVVLTSSKLAEKRAYPVLATILNTAMNHGGAAPGLTVPSEAAQESVIRDALQRAAIDPKSIDYIETHGTGTQLGDPIEIGALRSVFGKRDASQPLKIGSAKTNIGHLNATSGLAGLMKTVLMLQHETIVPTLHYDSPNPDIPWDGFPVEIPSEHQGWIAAEEKPRRAGVSSFGLSGTNTHVVVEGVNPQRTSESESPLVDTQTDLFVLSAKNEQALIELAKEHLEFQKRFSNRTLASVCYASSAGRTHHKNRVVIECSNWEEWSSSLAALIDGKADSRTRFSASSDEIVLQDRWVIEDHGTELFNAMAASVPSLEQKRVELRNRLQNLDDVSATQKEAVEELIALYTVGEYLISLGLPVYSLSGIGIGLLVSAILSESVSLTEAVRFLVSESEETLSLKRPKRSFLSADGSRINEISRHDLQEGKVGGSTEWPLDDRNVFVIGDEWLKRLHNGSDQSQESIEKSGEKGQEELLKGWLYERISEAYLTGEQIRWDLVYRDRNVTWVPIPTYRFQRKRFWLDKVETVKESVANQPTANDSAAKQSVGPSTSNLLNPLENPTKSSLSITEQMTVQLKQTAQLIQELTQKQLDEWGGSILQKAEQGVDSNRLAGGQKASTKDQEETTGSDLKCGVWNLELLPSPRVMQESGYLLYQDGEDLEDVLQKADKKRLIKAARAEEAPVIVMMFPGVGDHYLNMGQGLYQNEPVFRKALDECNEITSTLLGFDLLEILYPNQAGEEASSQSSTIAKAPNGQSVEAEKPAFDLRAMLGRGAAPVDPATEILNRTLHSQPLVFMIEYALGQLWLSKGIRPSAMIGYSIGEYTAAVLSGVMTLEDALKLIVKRAQLIETIPSGIMLAVPLSEGEIRASLPDSLSIAIQSTPSQCVIAGPEDAITEFEKKMAEQEIVTRRLQSSHAFHSSMLKPLHDPLVELVSGFTLSAPQIPFISNVTGDWITSKQVNNPAYWAEHTWNTVRFSDGLSKLLDANAFDASSYRLFHEVGPGVSLGSFMLQHPAGKAISKKINLPSLKTMYERTPDEQFLLQTIGRLYLAGVEMEIKSLVHAEPS